MRKTGTSKDEFRRRDHVAKLQDSEEWSKFRKLPPANDMWPTALIVAPSSVAMNWQRELDTVRPNFSYGSGTDVLGSALVGLFRSRDVHRRPR